MITSFINPGMVDYRAITTQGASVKECENPIGYFGTGFKYAIAIILRNGGKINVYRGLERLEFTAKPVQIRGKTFQVVCMNDKELGFTTELGKNWVMWQAFREIYCNTLDEHGRLEHHQMKPQPGHTLVVVEHQEFAQCAKDRHQYVLEKTPLVSGEEADLHAFCSSRLYYRKILVVPQTHKPWKYTPNIKGEMTLTEDRTLKNTWGIDSCITKTLTECTDAEFLENWLSVGDHYAEHTVDVCGQWTLPSKLMVQVGTKIFKDSRRSDNLNTSMRLYLKKQQGEELPQAVTLLAMEDRILAKAIKRCKEIGYAVDEYPIVVTETLGDGILGKAYVKDAKIFIAKQALLSGDQTLMGTLIEEWCHIKHGHHDCSRGMQNWLLDNLVRMGLAYLESQEDLLNLQRKGN